MVMRYDAMRKAMRAASKRIPRGLISKGQSMVEFALISSVAMMVMMIGVQFALIGQAALAVSQGASALARYAAVNPGALGTNGTVTVTTVSAPAQLLSSSILTGTNNSDLTVTIASYTGTTTTTTSSPGYTDRVLITVSYSAAGKIALPNPFFGIHFPTTLASSDSQMYE